MRRNHLQPPRRLIGVNLNNCRFSSRIIAEATKPHRFDLLPGQTKDFHFYDHIYTGLGYQIVGDTAVLPPPPNPFLSGSKPPWAK
jgi:hypothetical protein